jgi:bacillopeptidase F (M6 metalloprotease family)
MENWDSVTAPALPPGWIATNPVPGDGVMWETTTTMPESSPNNVFVADQDGISDKVLDRMGVNVTSATATLSFRNNFKTDISGPVFCGGYVLEVSAPNISGSDFLDITDSRVGGSFVTGGYTVLCQKGGTTPTISPTEGRMVWGGNSGGYIDTVINMGPNLAGQTITLRFRMFTDEAVAAPGVHIDNLVFTGASCP